MNGEIKPCPFCGSEAVLNGEEKTFWIECENCLLETSFFESKEEILEYWNNRKEEKE